MGPCSRPGEDPNAWKQFGPKRVSVKAAWQRDVESGTESALSPRAAIHTRRRLSSWARLCYVPPSKCYRCRLAHQLPTPIMLDVNFWYDLLYTRTIYNEQLITQGQ
jgi:hypothetical protein